MGEAPGRDSRPYADVCTVWSRVVHNGIGDVVRFTCRNCGAFRQCDDSCYKVQMLLILVYQYTRLNGGTFSKIVLSLAGF